MIKINVYLILVLSLILSLNLISAVSISNGTITYSSGSNSTLRFDNDFTLSQLVVDSDATSIYGLPKTNYLKITSINTSYPGKLNVYNLSSTLVYLSNSTKLLLTGGYNFTIPINNYTILNYLGFVENSQSFRASTYELSSEKFSISISYDSSTYGILAYLFYNNTIYYATKTASGDTVVFNVSLITPDVTALTAVPFYWVIGLSNSTSTIYYPSSNQTQSVGVWDVDDCSVNNLTIINYTLLDEDTRQLFNTSLYNTSIQVETIIRSVEGNSYFRYNNTKSNVNTFAVCLPSGVLNQSSFRLDSTVKFVVDNYESEFHYIRNYTLTNNTIPKLVSLYDLKTVRSTEYLVKFYDSNFLTVEGVIISAYRKYIPVGTFEVENGLTDSSGQTVLHLVSNSEIYDFVVTKEGQFIFSLNNTIAACIASPCQINIYQGQAQPDLNFDPAPNVLYTAYINESLKTINVAFSTINGTPTNMSLKVKVWDSYLNNTICTDSMFASSGILTCTVPSEYWNSSLYTILYENDKPISAYNNQFQTETNKPNFGYTGIILGAFSYLTLGLLAISSGVAMIIFAILGVILIGLFYLINSGSILGVGSTVMWFIIAGGIILWKLSSRRND